MNPSVNLDTNHRLSFDELVEVSDSLYSKALREGPDLIVDDQGSSVLDHLLKEIDLLLEKLNQLAKDTPSLTEYQWLVDALFRWQVLFASTLNIPKKIALPTPRRNLLPPLLESKALTEEEIKFLIRRNDDYLTRLEQSKDSSLTSFGINRRESASIFLAFDILEGKINLASRISSASYYRLEKIWVQDIKRLVAYFIWEGRKGGIDEELAKRDFINASNSIRSLLVNHEIKAQRAEFGEAKEYLEECFLGLDGQLDLQKNQVKALITAKANKIQDETDCAKFDQNWELATAYVTLFYEHILPAVLDNEPESVRSILKAFQYSQYGEKGNSYHIINAFEAALVIYFVDATSIRKIWGEAGHHRVHNQPEFFNPVHLPKDLSLKIPDAFKHRFGISAKGNLYFKGLMTNADRQALQENLDQNSRRIIEQLYRQSRIVSEHETL